MAPRTLKIRHDDETRAKIQTSQLLNRLNDHVFGKDEKPVEVSATQMKAIEILLRKTLPDLSAVTVAGDEDSPVELRVTWQSKT
jgi:hypothetical protein